MSHVAALETRAGEPVFADIACLRQAAEMIGCRLVEKNTYKWWGSHVGDYPVPAGMKVDELGKNAKYVIEATPESVSKHGLGSCYDIGIVEDPRNPGCYLPVYDFYGQSHGIDKLVGSPVHEAGKLKTICPRLIQHYHLCCDAHAAADMGDSVEFLTAKDAHLRFPHLFPEPTNDEDTWVSIVDTQQRVPQSTW